MNCTKVVYLKPTCLTISNITGTITDVIENSRVISFTSTTVTFTAVSGVNNYTFLLTDTSGIVHSVTFKNIIC